MSKYGFFGCFEEEMDKVFPLILRSIGIKKPCGRSGFSLGSTGYGGGCTS